MLTKDYPQGNIQSICELAECDSFLFSNYLDIPNILLVFENSYFSRYKQHHQDMYQMNKASKSNKDMFEEHPI